VARHGRACVSRCARAPLPVCSGAGCYVRLMWLGGSPTSVHSSRTHLGCVWWGTAAFWLRAYTPKTCVSAWGRAPDRAVLWSCRSPVNALKHLSGTVLVSGDEGGSVKVTADRPATLARLLRTFLAAAARMRRSEQRVWLASPAL
jgi:hypothetical protein